MSDSSPATNEMFSLDNINNNDFTISATVAPSPFVFSSSSLSTYNTNDTSLFKTSCLPPIPTLSDAETQEILQPLNNALHKHTNNASTNNGSTGGKAKKRKKTHTDVSMTVPALDKFVELPEEELLKLDSQQVEQYLKTLTEYRTLSADEEKELKKLRRLIKNREYAQSSRNKRKQYIEEMEGKLDVSETILVACYCCVHFFPDCCSVHSFSPSHLLSVVCYLLGCEPN